MLLKLRTSWLDSIFPANRPNDEQVQVQKCQIGVIYENLEWLIN